LRQVIILSNALDDATRVARGIETDSPAASRKVFMAAAAIRKAGVATTVVSLGRGRKSGPHAAYPPTARRARGAATVYLRFDNRPIWSELVSLVAGAMAMRRIASKRRDTILIVYNRSPAYVPAMLVAKIVGIPIVLDLEDGTPPAKPSLHSFLRKVADRLFDTLCVRALLACSALEAATRLRPVMPYYGIAPANANAARFMSPTVTVLLGGTVDRDTGGELLADTVEAIRQAAPPWAAALAIEVTGKGASIPRLAALAEQPGGPVVRVWGRTSDADYAAILAATDVGLALKPNHGLLAQTTFPSKVIEMAAAGQLVVTTDISDVRAVLGNEGALYQKKDTVEALAAHLEWIVGNRLAARALAKNGSTAVTRIGDPARAGRQLIDFIFSDVP